MVEVGVPAAVVIEDRDMAAAVDIGPKVFIGHYFDAWHGSLS
jgi:hypothetical protein